MINGEQAAFRRLFTVSFLCIGQPIQVHRFLVTEDLLPGKFFNRTYCLQLVHIKVFLIS